MKSAVSKGRTRRIAEVEREVAAAEDALAKLRDDLIPATIGTVPAAKAAHTPRRLDLREAGAIPITGLTALQGVERLGLRKGAALAIHGASGGVGTIAVQFARLRGARVFATASGKDGIALVRRLGAEEAVDGKRDDLAAAARRFAPDGLDALLAFACESETSRLNEFAILITCGSLQGGHRISERQYGCGNLQGHHDILIMGERRAHTIIATDTFVKMSGEWKQVVSHGSVAK